MLHFHSSALAITALELRPAYLRIIKQFKAPPEAALILITFTGRFDYHAI